jgi:FMN phosphatase YigB (HAD superfamily)
VTRILDRYQVILLDMNGTFMFEEDRFGPAHDYHATYRALGGTQLRSEELRQAVSQCYDQLSTHYSDPSHCDCFPQVREVLTETCTSLPQSEIDLIEAAFARHELGQVPAEYAAALRWLSKSHTLGVVSNIWSKKPLWLDEFRRAGILDLFAALVFSSDGPSIKPSPLLFRQALATLGVPLSSVVYVGDSLRCDVGGASATGIASVWVNRKGTTRPNGSPVPTFEVRSLLELVP